MNEDSRTDWKRVLNMTDAEVTANALKDPDSLPLPPTGGTKEIHLSEEDGATLLERFRKALERERKVLISVDTMRILCVGIRRRERDISLS